MDLTSSQCLIKCFSIEKLVVALTDHHSENNLISMEGRGVAMDGAENANLEQILLMI